jgi:23S rRNA (cytidine1920-2'-O)/16S rRNA (cytidine1409-2'-O)-methyltransferase
MARRRLDAELVRRGLVPSREAAKREIEAGRVVVGGAPATKPARLVLPGDDVRVLGPPPKFVSRAGQKLEAALDQFSVDPSGLTVLDAGSSTGGFTDCLLQRHASKVVAVDVGTHQLHERIRADQRVDVREQTDVRSVNNETIGGPVDLVVGDLSFISLKLVLGALVRVSRSGGPLLLLIKPQFEAGREEAAKGRGVITDPEIHRRVIDEVRDAALSHGAIMLDVMTSPITGNAGNVEFVGYFRTAAADAAPVQQSGIVE